ncbi:MAG TPA: nucleotide sugar dehydrogenase, partial [Candidatus Babeliales bacterium]|nr:nucleotide sugar dehydrogenase [Candidatus Babeliales bacterium]
DPDQILTVLQSLLSDEKIFSPTSVYGDGFSAEKIVPIIKQAIAETAEASSYEQEVQHKGSIRLTFNDLGIKKVCIIGLGYIGLPTAILAAEHGFEVVGVDIDTQRVEKINGGDPVIQEPEVFEKLQCVLNAGRFRATTTAQMADFFIIAVPTPCKIDKTADISFVFNAVKAFMSVIKKGDVIILESTVPVGTTQRLAQLVQNETGLQVGTDIFVAHCPERVLPGNIFYELINNARIIGGIDCESANRAAALYKEFVQGDLHLTDAPTAELVKLVENSSRDTQIAFAHQVASMAYSAGIDPYEVIELANKHPRVNILNPTCGVGGHCIAVDPWFLIETFPKQSLLLKASRAINDAKPIETIRCIQKAVEQWQPNHEKKCTVLVFGLTYKADVDDIRESPALLIARHLATLPTIDLLVYEPHISKSKIDELFEDRTVSLTEGLHKADIVVFLVAHNRFKAIDVKMLATKKVLDFCGILHQRKPKSDQKEYLFWPVSSNKLDRVENIQTFDDTFTNKGQESSS